jgi:hypothetical protein
MRAAGASSARSAETAHRIPRKSFVPGSILQVCYRKRATIRPADPLSATANVRDCAVRGNRRLPQSASPPRGRTACRGTGALQPAVVLFPVPDNVEVRLRFSRQHPPRPPGSAARVPGGYVRTVRGLASFRVGFREPDDWTGHCFLNRPALTCSHGRTFEGFCS